MNYILDTHVFLWSLFDSKKLSKRAGNIILDIENNINVSVISFFEISLKYSLGKLELTNILPEELPAMAEKAGFNLFELNPEDAASFYRLPKMQHKDPFDRLIIWQSIKSKAVLISKDLGFDVYKDLGLKVVW